MITGQLHEVVAARGAYQFLRAVERRTSTTWFGRAEIDRLLDENGVDDAGLLSELVASGIVVERSQAYSLSKLGIRTTLLLEALNEGNVREVFDRLSQYDGSLRMYQLVREGMTREFIANLVRRPGFQRLYLCSPWISFRAEDQRALMTVIHREERRGFQPEVLVITRPAQGTSRTPPASVAPLVDLGATVYLHPRLHTKLYIREPGLSGGDTMAIVGSQNLTRSTYLELGIRINSDTRVVGQLIAYFFDVSTSCIEPG